MIVRKHLEMYGNTIEIKQQENVTLLDQLKSGFKRTINWNKYQSKASISAQYWYLDYLIYPSFQGVNRLFVLPFKDDTHWTSYDQYFPTVEIKSCNAMIDGRILFG